MKVYVASSWRNQRFDSVVKTVIEAGHAVYDFKHPSPEYDGFHWSRIDPNWKEWSPEQFRAALGHKIARNGFEMDMNALRWCDTCFLVMPCGRSAHLELGWAAGAGKQTIILLEDGEPELMYGMSHYLCIDMDEVLNALGNP
jgi:hypothetical protein